MSHAYQLMTIKSQKGTCEWKKCEIKLCRMLESRILSKRMVSKCLSRINISDSFATNKMIWITCFLSLMSRDLYHKLALAFQSMVCRFRGAEYCTRSAWLGLRFDGQRNEILHLRTRIQRIELQRQGYWALYTGTYKTSKWVLKTKFLFLKKYF